ncbi:nucleotide exchange factor GrpE [Alicyclobacillus sp. ALC3]|uniref:nucleotide exchange factor GrpE n=1 Tax=Alicyclobacillus sp. ALC3 TaxID=2796143 RepID=UPI0023794997|nr:nucleotide exchange factor GrpE [Alicyclobacillus sp. ALC3]WDL96328.1 nucleotide exchange factor GrpE [Alicyclobacillus sp. ALC3]
MSEQARESTADQNLETEPKAIDENKADDGPDEVDGAQAVELEVEEIGEVEQESAVQTSESEQLRQQLMRLQADFDNFRKRTRHEREELQSFATRKLLGELLPIVDNFDRAMSALTAADAQLQTVRTGVEMVQRQLLTLLSQYEVRPMEVLGQAFDPNVHEAVLQEPAGDGAAGIVQAELQKGYWLGDRVLRPAMVKVTV